MCKQFNVPAAKHQNRLDVYLWQRSADRRCRALLVQLLSLTWMAAIQSSWYSTSIPCPVGLEHEGSPVTLPSSNQRHQSQASNPKKQTLDILSMKKAITTIRMSPEDCADAGCSLTCSVAEKSICHMLQILQPRNMIPSLSFFFFCYTAVPKL